MKRIRKSIEEDDPDEVTFDYEDGWDEMMEEAKPEIAAQVEELKHN